LKNGDLKLENEVSNEAVARSRPRIPIFQFSFSNFQFPMSFEAPAKVEFDHRQWCPAIP